MGILILSPMGAGIADRGSGWRPPPSIRRSLLLRRLLRRARCAVRSAKPSPVGLDIQAWFLVPLEKFLKQHLFFIIVQHRIKAFSFPLSMPRSLAPIAGRIVVADVAGSPGWARRLRRSRLLRVQIGRRVCSSTPCLLRSAADLGTGGGFGSRHLFSPAVAFPRRRVRRGTVGAGPFEPFRAVLRRGVCSHHRGNCNHSGKHAELGCYCHILPARAERRPPSVRQAALKSLLQRAVWQLLVRTLAPRGYLRTLLYWRVRQIASHIVFRTASTPTN